MAWCYCRKCDAGQDEPTEREVLEGDYSCHQCGSSLDPLKSTNEIILSLLERIEKLESNSSPND